MRPSPMAAVCAALLALALPISAAADEPTPRQDAAGESDWRFTVGAGALYAPDYTGSDEYEPTPFPFVRIENGPLYVRTDGPGVKANVMPHGLFEFGPVIRYGGGRSDVEDDVVDRLPEIDDALLLGLFAGYTHKGVFGNRDSLGVEIEATWATSDDNGATVTLGTTYGVRATRSLSLSIGPSVTYASSDYADTYFSVDAAGSAASGLSQFSAESGLRDVALTVSARYTITPQIALGGFAGVSRLMGDFADSPIVDERGSATQASGGLFLTYTF